MASRDNRPVHLNLFVIRMPVPAVMSIAHRASGVLMVLLTPILIYALQQSLSGPEGFADVAQWCAGLLGKLVLFLLLWALLHHLFAGFRYLFLDIHIGVDKKPERTSAWAVMIGAPVAALVLMLGVSL
jgi:succinate dehydrogenase / fumarate reductase cytochrome b subunit